MGTVAAKRQQSILFIVLLLALTACAGDPASKESAGPTATATARVAEARTSMPTPFEPSPTAPRPTATFVPLVTPSATVDGPTRTDVPRIGVLEAKAKMDAGEALLVDVRTEGAYKGKHIAGAISIPVDQVSRRHAQLPDDKLIIFYCA
ncbi:MAG: rhodanese-like domain-containing protein [Anaerolineae bacterium]